MKTTQMVSFACILGLAAIVACTTVKQEASIDLKQVQPGTYALFSFAIEGTGNQRPHCRININQKATKQVQTYIFPSGSWGLISLPAGTYSYDNIDCGYGSRYLVSNPFGKKQNEFSLVPGKINYLGHTTLVFDAQKDLKLRYDQKDHLIAMRSLLTTLPNTTWAANNLISTYTQRTIKGDMMAFELPRSYSVKSRAPKEEQEKLKGLLAIVQSKIGKCAETESVTNPLKIGALQVIYVHRNGKFVEGDRRDTHVYSKAFVGCVQGSMASITYTADYPVSIHMAL